MKKTQRPGLRLLYKTLNLPVENLSEDDISFMITPRINAASRMSHPDDAFYVLSTSDMKEAREGVAHLEKINNERKGLVASLVKEVKKRLKQRTVDRVLVIGDPMWKPSVLGLVAGKLADEYDVPVFAWGREGGENLKGSCRGGGGVNVVELMELCKEKFLEFGGHKEAGGFSLLQDNIFDLEKHMQEKVLEMDVTDGESVVSVDKIISIDDVGESMVADLKKIAPFGIANHKPLFLIENIQPESVRKFGKEKNHLEVLFVNAKGKRIKGIYFFITDDVMERMKDGKEEVNFLVHVEESFWAGRREIRLRVVDCF